MSYTTNHFAANGFEVQAHTTLGTMTSSMLGPRTASPDPLSPSSSDVAATLELAKPLYVRIHEFLAEKILRGTLPPGSRLPSERELSRDLDVSRMTARRAITELVDEGLLVRRHGSGTYVAEVKVTLTPVDLISYGRALRARGLKVTTQLLEFAQAPASRRLAEGLQVDLGQTLYRVVRLRLANRVPAIIEKSYLPASLVPRLEEYDLEKSSLFDLLKEAYGITVTRADHFVEAIPAEPPVSDQLRIEEGAPLLAVSRALFIDGGRPVAYSQDVLVGDRARLQWTGPIPPTVQSP